MIEKRLLQAILAVAALVPLAAGAGGVIWGPAFLGLEPPWPAALDSHLRFLSGLFIVVGLGWMSCIPAIERKGERLLLLGAMTFAGGLARLYSAMLVGLPPVGHRYGLFAELVLVPLVLLWQRRIARKSGQ